MRNLLSYQLLKGEASENICVITDSYPSYPSYLRHGNTSDVLLKAKKGDSMEELFLRMNGGMISSANWSEIGADQFYTNNLINEPLKVLNSIKRITSCKNDHISTFMKYSMDISGTKEVRAQIAEIIRADGASGQLKLTKDYPSKDFKKYIKELKLSGGEKHAVGVIYSKSIKNKELISYSILYKNIKTIIKNTKKFCKKNKLPKNFKGYQTKIDFFANSFEGETFLEQEIVHFIRKDLQRESFPVFTSSFRKFYHTVKSFKKDEELLKGDKMNFDFLLSSSHDNTNHKLVEKMLRSALDGTIGNHEDRANFLYTFGYYSSKKESKSTLDSARKRACQGFKIP